MPSMDKCIKILIENAQFVTINRLCHVLCRLWKSLMPNNKSNLVYGFWVYSHWWTHEAKREGEIKIKFSFWRLLPFLKFGVRHFK